LLEKEKGDVESAYQAEIAALQAVSDKSSTTGAQRIGVDQKIADARQKMVDALKKLDADQEILSQQTSARNARDQAALKAFSQNVQDSLSLAQQGLDNQLAGIGLGSEARQRLQDDLKIRQDYQKQVERLSRDYANIVNPSLGQKDNYNKETQILKDALEQRLSAQRDYYSKLQGFQADWTNGARAALQDYIVEAGNIAGQTEHLFSDALHGVEDVFVDLATTGKLSFKSLADSIIADLARIIAKTLIVQPLISALFGGGGGGGGVAALGGLAAIFGSSGSSGSSASTSGGTSIGSLANSASSAYSIVTGVGPAASAGYTSGGVVGAVKGVASYYGNITSSAVSTIAGSASQIAAALTGQTAAYGATQGAYTGSAYASWVASQGASQGAASAGGSAAGGAALWPLAIIMGMYQSGKLYDAGLRYDKGEIEGSDLSKLGDKLGTAGLDRKLAFESIGLADKVASKLFGGKIGAMLSGSTFAMSVENMISSKLFGTGYQTKDSGLSLQVNNGDLDAQSYIDQKKKGGLLSGKSKSRTLYSALDDDQATQLQGLYAATQLGVVDLVKQIGITVEDGAFDAMKVAELKISTQGKTEDEIQAAVSGWFSYASDVMVATLDKGVNGFGYSFTELARRINVFTGFNAQLDVIDVKMFKLSASSMELANSLVEAAGGTDAMTANINTYYDKFFSDSEKTSDALAAVQKQFSDMGVSLPVTRDAYRAMVSAIDLTTDAGQQLFLKLTSAAGAAASAYDILESRTQAATAAAFSALQRSVTAQQKSTTDAYNAQVTSINDMASAASKSVTDMTAISTSLANALKALNGTSDDAVKMLRAQARATLESALATARSGGSLAGFDGLDDALSAVSSNNTDLYSSLEEFNRDQGRTANVVAELNDLNGKQLSSAEEMVKNLQDQLKLAADSYKLQMDALQAQLDYGQAQLDALNGVDTSVKTVAAAVAAMNAAVVAALATLPRTGAGSAMANTPENNSTLIDSIYQTVLGRDTSNDAGGAAYWAQLLNSGALTYDQAAAAIANSAVSGGGTAADAANAGKYLGLPGYAKGTNSWDGSPALVGEFGPEIVSANSLGAATIYPAQRSRSLLGAGGEESSQAANDTQSFREKIVKKVNEIARAVSFLDIWNSDGLPATRV
jgi:lambda family phage tail tape measure protein